MRKNRINLPKKGLAILGSTGSIGTQTLDVVERYGEIYKVELLSANDNYEKLAEQAVRFDVKDVVICNSDHYEALKAKLSGTKIGVHAGMDAVCSLVTRKDIEIVVAAMVGFSGLRSTIAALKADKIVALANKETLVAAGGIVEQLVRSTKSSIIPVDSEHSAIFQCLQGNMAEKVAKIHLTASGGPFRTWTKERIASVTKADALNHPNWKMGAKITIDSATMMNKGLELIEAKWLFGVAPEDISIIVHPQSIVHSMVEFEDGAVLAQMGTPDMREPIQYALSYPHRIPLNNKKLDFAALGALEFFAPDPERFPCLDIALHAIEKGGTAPVVMNAANEIAVAAFLEDKTGFYGIPDIIERTLEGMDFVENPSLEDIYTFNDEARKYARTLVK